MNLKDKNLYYVGGVVRDKFLGLASLDVDYTYVGNAIEFAQTRNVIKENKAFGTVRILGEDNKEIDIASTRKEIYPRAGHLPKVVQIGCPLEEDLIRRDFTINAMACNTLDNKIVDPFGGQADIADKKLRVLHENSFKDDPTRIIRGLKFSVRFGFDLDENTKLLQDQYLASINYDMCYHRIKKELKETFNLNSKKAYDIFVGSGIYKLLGENQGVSSLNLDIEQFLNNYSSPHIWLIYLGCFDLSKFELTRAEKRILEWFERLKTQQPTNNTPEESILMHKIWNRDL